MRTTSLSTDSDNDNDSEKSIKKTLDVSLKSAKTIESSYKAEKAQAKNTPPRKKPIWAKEREFKPSFLATKKTSARLNKPI